MVQNYTCPPPMPDKKSSPQKFWLYQTYEKCIMNIIDFLNEKTQHNDSSSLSTECVGLKSWDKKKVHWLFHRQLEPRNGWGTLGVLCNYGTVGINQGLSNIPKLGNATIPWYDNMPNDYPWCVAWVVHGFLV
jgi:hypothetical protein